MPTRPSERRRHRSADEVAARRSVTHPASTRQRNDSRSASERVLKKAGSKRSVLQKGRNTNLEPCEPTTAWRVYSVRTARRDRPLAHPAKSSCKSPLHVIN